MVLPQLLFPELLYLYIILKIYYRNRIASSVSIVGAIWTSGYGCSDQYWIPNLPIDYLVLNELLNCLTGYLV